MELSGRANLGLADPVLARSICFAVISKSEDYAFVFPLFTL